MSKYAEDEYIEKNTNYIGHNVAVETANLKFFSLTISYIVVVNLLVLARKRKRHYWSDIYDSATCRQTLMSLGGQYDGDFFSHWILLSTEDINVWTSIHTKTVFSRYTVTRKILYLDGKKHNNAN